jgi:hypothetical protein
MAQTVALKLEAIERMDRMLASAEGRRDAALRELTRHREALAVVFRADVMLEELARFEPEVAARRRARRLRWRARISASSFSTANSSSRRRRSHNSRTNFRPR